MSAGALGHPHADADTSRLAPKFRAAVDDGLIDCHADGVDAVVFEAGRSEELQEEYYERGRTVHPPAHPVTNAQSALYSWHGFLLAVDIISLAEGWFNPAAKPELHGLPNTHPRVLEYVRDGDAWFRKMAERLKRHGCKAGLDWKNPDPPHVQWGLCKPSPSALARQLLAKGGVQMVWKAVGAN